MFLDYAENLARKGKELYMTDWQDKLDVFLEFNEYEVLQNYGSIRKATADKLAIAEYMKFRPIQDAGYKSDFDNIVSEIQSTGKLPKSNISNKDKVMSDFNKSIKKSLDYNPKDN